MNENILNVKTQRLNFLKATNTKNYKFSGNSIDESIKIMDSIIKEIRVSTKTKEQARIDREFLANLKELNSRKIIELDSIEEEETNDSDELAEKLDSHVNNTLINERVLMEKSLTSGARFEFKKLLTEEDLEKLEENT